jgi:uncharacterized 2Fe-2S/4Fe-4S cluster protein (DUF4445 family)
MSSLSLAPQTCRIDFEPIGKRVEVPVGTLLFEAARQAGIGLASVCGGEGNCGRCRVAIMSGDVSPAVDADLRYLSALERSAGQRLACHAHALGDVKVQVPKASLVTDQRLQIGGVARRMHLEAAVQAHELEVPEPSLTDLRSDLERVIDMLEISRGQRKWWAEPAVIRTLSGLARRENWHLTAYTRGAEIVGLAAPGRKPVGFACDLGTTKVAGYLVDLETGVELAATGVMNPQISYGEDVISRIVHATQGEAGSNELARLIREALNAMIGALALEAGVAREQVVEACIVGNTAMTHLLLDLPLQQLAVAPFVAAASGALNVKARDLALDMAAGSYVHILPGVGGFVGADHVAMILGSDLDRKPGVVIGVDIGTNTEIALCCPDQKLLMSASCASGPAFEGAHIHDGMRAAPGAIEAVRLGPGGPELKTIGDVPAVGLCGSGIVDVMAEMHRTGVINARGRLNRAAAGVRRGEGGWEFLLVPGASSGTGRDIVVTQQDISEIQLAKGAIATGLQLLLTATRTPLAAVAEVIVAGAFGSYLNLESALAIGLLPRLPNAVYQQVGNAAGVGARMALLSLKERQRAAHIAHQAGYIELTTQPDFNNQFVQSLLFPTIPAAA